MKNFNRAAAHIVAKFLLIGLFSFGISYNTVLASDPDTLGSAVGSDLARDASEHLSDRSERFQDPLKQEQERIIGMLSGEYVVPHYSRWKQTVCSVALSTAFGGGLGYGLYKAGFDASDICEWTGTFAWLYLAVRSMIKGLVPGITVADGMESPYQRWLSHNITALVATLPSAVTLVEIIARATGATWQDHIIMQWLNYPIGGLPAVLGIAQMGFDFVKGVWCVSKEQKLAKQEKYMETAQATGKQNTEEYARTARELEKYYFEWLERGIDNFELSQEGGQLDTPFQVLGLRFSALQHCFDFRKGCATNQLISLDYLIALKRQNLIDELKEAVAGFIAQSNINRQSVVNESITLKMAVERQLNELRKYIIDTPFYWDVKDDSLKKALEAFIKKEHKSNYDTLRTEYNKVHSLQWNSIKELLEADIASLSDPHAQLLPSILNNMRGSYEEMGRLLTDKINFINDAATALTISRDTLPSKWQYFRGMRRSLDNQSDIAEVP